MTNSAVSRRFQVTNLRSLRSAPKIDLENIDGIWASVSNDAFLALRTYVEHFTGVTLNGYRAVEDRDAYEACARTLDALEEIIVRMNESRELLRLADVVFTEDGLEPKGFAEILPEIEGTWDRVIATPVASPATAALTGTIKREFINWAATGGEHISALLSYTSAPATRDLELVFSGGGMRAAAFALGALMYVADVDKAERIGQISSVSGGSLTNGFLAHTITSKGLIGEDSVAVFVQRLATQGLPLEKAGWRWLVLPIVAMGFALVANALVLFVAVGANRSLLWGSLAFFAGFAYLAVVSFASFRGLTDDVVGVWCARIIGDSTVPGPTFSRLGPFSRKRARFAMSDRGGLLRLSELKSPMTHVFTTTDLRFGEHLHFSQHWVTSNAYGSTDPGDVRVYEAVRASAAFPGALAPVRIGLDRLTLPQHLTADISFIELVDGGVRDNLGHMFQTQILADVPSQTETLTRYGSTRVAIVVDASAPRGAADLTETIWSRIPVVRKLGQLITFPRVISIMGQSNSEARSLAIARGFSRDINGCVVRICESPVDVCRRVIDNPEISRELLASGRGSGHQSDPRKHRAEAALRALSRSSRAAESYWNGLRNYNGTVRTTLDGLGAKCVADLLQHAYVLTMCQAHIELDWPLAPDKSWSSQRFSDLVVTSHKRSRADNPTRAMSAAQPPGAATPSV